MRKLKKISGNDCIKILVKYFGFERTRQKGSHVVLKKISLEGTVGTVVPLHKELKIGTLKNVLKLERVDEEEFAKFQ